MRFVLVANHVLIALFGIASGAYKVFGGEADVRIFATLGMTPTVVALFGGLQALTALLTIPPASRRAGALALAACNALASLGLFVAGQYPFGVVSLLLVAMAWVVARVDPSVDARTRRDAVPLS